MNLPSAVATPTSESADASAKSPEICDNCGSHDSWVIHSARLRGILRSFCTHCLLRNHPGSFCPSCLAFYDSSPPHQSRRVPCADCNSVTHSHCAGDAIPNPYLCPPCRDPDSFSFFRPMIRANGVRAIDKSLSGAFLCATRIASSSMNKTVYAVKCEVERKGKDAAVAKRRAREALEDVLKLDEKAKSAIPKLKEAFVELSTNRDQKPKISPASNEAALKEIESSATIPTTNSGKLKKQSPSLVQFANVKQEK